MTNTTKLPAKYDIYVQWYVNRETIFTCISHDGFLNIFLMRWDDVVMNMNNNLIKCNKI